MKSLAGPRCLALYGCEMMSPRRWCHSHFPDFSFLQIFLPGRGRVAVTEPCLRAVNHGAMSRRRGWSERSRCAEEMAPVLPSCHRNGACPTSVGKGDVPAWEGTATAPWGINHALLEASASRVGGVPCLRYSTPKSCVQT